ncbi:MAG: ATP-binding protein [Mycoplasmataceae bacterium]|nr:ATP-binding protein [Mycoplasmataceae bacterium]
MQEIIRTYYLNTLIEWKDKHFIKVITGVRRSGKSTILNQFKTKIIKDFKVNKNQIISYDFNDLILSQLKYLELYKDIISKSSKNIINYVFLDEIQEIENFEKVVISLFENKEYKYDIYITGSNSKMFSSNLSTLFTGRNIEIKVFPLSFKEFYGCAKDILKNNDKTSIFNKYLNYGGLPIILESLDNNKEIEKILSTVFDDTVQRDIHLRHSIKKIRDFENFAKYVYFNIGSTISTINVSNYIKTNNKTKIAHTTIERYLKWLEESLLIYRTDFYHIGGKKLLQKSAKYYSVDTGIRNAESKFEISNKGFLLENIVFLELLRNDYKVFVGTLRDGEIDFVCEKNNIKTYIQVTTTLETKEIIEREYGNLKKIHDSNKKIVISLEQNEGTDDFGIESKNIINWLLAEK